MDGYNLFADAMSTFRAVNDWIKALIVLEFYGTVIALGLAGILRLRGAPADTPTLTPEPPKLTRMPPTSHFLVAERDTARGKS